MRNPVYKSSPKPIRDEELGSVIFIMDNRIYSVDTRKDITDQTYVALNGVRYNVRKVAFYLIHKRWPASGFLLPWENSQ